jgi:hypothetical protein
MLSSSREPSMLHSDWGLIAGVACTRRYVSALFSMLRRATSFLPSMQTILFSFFDMILPDKFQKI